MNPTIVEVHDLSLAFSRKKVLDGLSVSFARGEWAVIAGRNGVGKSTLLRCLAGVLLPDAGSIVWAEEARPGKDRLYLRPPQPVRGLDGGAGRRLPLPGIRGSRV